MGYYIDMVSHNFFIKNENKQKAFKAAFDAGFTEGESLCELFKNHQDFTCVDEKDDGFTILEMERTKIWDQKDFFDVIAPFVENQSFIEMIGEDYKMFRYVFDGEACIIVYPTITW